MTDGEAEVTADERRIARLTKALTVAPHPSVLIRGDVVPYLDWYFKTRLLALEGADDDDL